MLQDITISPQIDLAVPTYADRWRARSTEQRAADLAAYREEMQQPQPPHDLTLHFTGCPNCDEQIYLLLEYGAQP